MRLGFFYWFNAVMSLMQRLDDQRRVTSKWLVNKVPVICHQGRYSLLIVFMGRFFDVSRHTSWQLNTSNVEILLGLVLSQQTSQIFRIHKNIYHLKTFLTLNTYINIQDVRGTIDVSVIGLFDVSVNAFPKCINLFKRNRVQGLTKITMSPMFRNQRIIDKGIRSEAEKASVSKRQKMTIGALQIPIR